MRKYWSFLVALAILVVSLGQPVQAQRGRGYSPEPGFGYGFRRWSKEKLDLPTEQVKKLQTLELTFEKETANLFADIRIKQLELRELWTAETPEEKKINTKIEEIAKIRTEIEKKRVGHLLGLKKVLTEEQWLKLRCKPGFCGKGAEGPEPKPKRKGR